MIRFALGFAAGVGVSALARVGRREYVRKREKWLESARPTPVFTPHLVKTEGQPGTTATVRTYQVRPRKRP